MHTREEGSSNEGDLVHDKEDDGTPLLFKAPCSVTLDFFLPGARARNTEARAAGLGSEANVEGSDARVSRELDGGVDVRLLKKQANMLYDAPERPRFATARRAT